MNADQVKARARAAAALTAAITRTKDEATTEAGEEVLADRTAGGTRAALTEAARRARPR